MFFKSIKTRILVLQLGVVLSVAVTLGVVAYRIMFRSLMKYQQEHLGYVAANIGKELNLSIAYKERLIEKVGTSKVVESYFKRQQESLLIEYFSKFTPEFPVLSYVNENGLEKFKWSENGISTELFDIKDSAIFEKAIWNANKAVSMYNTPCAKPGGPYVEFGFYNRSFFDEFIGLIVGRVPVVALTEGIRGFQFGESGFAVLIDTDGTILSCRDKDRILKRVTIEGGDAKQLIFRMRSANPGFGRATILGIDGYIASAPVKGSGWTVLAILPYKEFITAPNTLRNVFVSIFVVVLIVAGLLSSVIASHITNPILSLVGIADSVAKGNLSQHINIESDDEVGVLAASFNRMVEDLKTSTTSIDNLNTANSRLKASQQRLREANEKLNESNRQLQEFVYVASHDLREPLRKINSFGELLTRSIGEKLNDDERENFNFMIDGANRMQQMIESLLIYSRVATKGVEFEKVDLNRTIEELRNLELSINLEETGGTILVPESLPVIKGDPTQMRQLLQNLIGNALKYHRKGIPPEVVIRSVGQKDGMIRIEVEDNGIGIDPEQYEEVFAMFRRLHSRQEYEGTGIGLAVCKRIVERHKGEIGVSSTCGRGSTFWFTLPAFRVSEKKPVKFALS